MAGNHYEQTLYQAKLSEIAHRYDDMADELAVVAELARKNKTALTEDQLHLFIRAYDAQIETRRTSLQELRPIRQKLLDQKSDLASVAAEKIGVIEKELRGVCDKTLKALETMPSPETSIEAKVLFLTWQADCWRCKAELATNADDTEAADNARKSYDNAMREADSLSVTDSARLRAALGYSVFLHDIVGDTEAASRAAKNAFDEATSEMDHLDEDQYKQSTRVMQLLRDNLTAWTAPGQGGL
ncbi:14-3-3 family protein [Nocardia sp. NPDC006044]|uniref:14-3-3 family protein n=1 Tax=Nocardia sp. NPDC006044 TaxID=3364306 RepID=UPI0036BF7F57